MMNFGAVVYLFGIGAAASFTLCSLFCMPVTFAYIMARQQGARKGLQAALIIGVARVMGFALAGAIAGHLRTLDALLVVRGSNVLVPMASAFVILLGFLILLGKDLSKAFCVARAGASSTWADLFAYGVMMAFVPCATHLAVLAYIVMLSAGWLSGSLLGASFGAGNMLMLLVSGWLAGSSSSAITSRGYAYAMRLVCGGLLVAAGTYQLVRHVRL